MPHAAFWDQVNMEYLQVDSRSFVTDDVDALAVLYGRNSDEGTEPRIAIKRIAQRLSTVFATLKVCPRPWYYVPQTLGRCVLLATNGVVTAFEEECSRKGGDGHTDGIVG